MVLITIWDNNSGGPIAANPGWYEQWFGGSITEGVLGQGSCSPLDQLVLSPAFPCPGSGIVVEPDPIDFGSLPPGELPDPDPPYNPEIPIDPPGGGTPPSTSVALPDTASLFALALVVGAVMRRRAQITS